MATCSTARLKGANVISRLILASLLLITVVAAQPEQPAPAKPPARGGGYKPPEGPAPTTPWGKPDLNGVWQRPYVPDVTSDRGQKGSGPLPFTEVTTATAPPFAGKTSIVGAG